MIISFPPTVFNQIKSWCVSFPASPALEAQCHPLARQGSPIARAFLTAVQYISQMESSAPCGDAQKATSDSTVEVTSVLSPLETSIRTCSGGLATQTLVISHQLARGSVCVLSLGCV